MTRQLAVIVVNYGSHGLLERNLVPLDLVAHGWRWLSSTTSPRRRNRSQYPDLGRERGWRTVLNDGNVGFGSAVNQGTGVGAELGARTTSSSTPILRSRYRTSRYYWELSRRRVWSRSAR